MGIGGPRLVRRAYARSLATLRTASGPVRSLGSSAGPQACFRFFGGASLVCRQGPLLYEMVGQFATSRPLPGVPTGTGKDAHDAQSKAWATHVTIPAAATIAAKL